MQLARIGVVVVVLCALASLAVAKPIKFEGVTLEEPAGWTKKDNDSGLMYLSNTGDTFIVLTKRLAGDRDANKNFTTGWSKLLTPIMNVAAPAPGNSSVAHGWTLVTGQTNFTTDGKSGVAMLISATTGTTTMHLLIVATSDRDAEAVQKFVASFQLPEVAPQKTPPPTTMQPAQPAKDSDRLYAKWNHTTSGQTDSVQNSGYTTSRYELRTDGTYRYTERAFWAAIKDIVIVEEAGTFAVDGDQLTVTPTSSKVSSYAKAGGVDTLGTRTSSKSRALEKVTYRFALHYFEGIKQWNLVLMASAPTKRDGTFSTNTTYKNAYYFDQQYTDTDLTAAKAK